MQATLSIPVAEIPPEGVSVACEVEYTAVQPPDAEAVAAEAIRLKGTLSVVSGEYLFRGSLAVTYVGACDRCLAGAIIPQDIEVTWEFGHAGAALEVLQSDEEMGEGDDFITYDEYASQQDGVYALAGNIIELAPCIWDELVLNVPIKMLCSEACPGLCPHCGSRAGECGCAKDDDHGKAKTGLAAIGDLFPNLMPPNGDKE